MAVSYVAVSNAAAQTAGTTTTASTVAITPTLPAGTASGDRVFVFQSFATAASSAAAPANWKVLYKDIVVGSGTAGAGTGLRRNSCYYRDYDGVWTMPSFALTSTAQNTHAVVAVTARKGASDIWDVPTYSAVGSDFGTANTTFTATTAAFQTVASALLIAHATQNDFVSMTSGAITGTNGFTAGTVTERADGGLATGNDVAIQIHTAIPSAAGSPIGTLTHTGTLSAASEGGVTFVQQTVTTPSGNTPKFAGAGAVLTPGAGSTANVPVPAGVAADDIILVGIAINFAGTVPTVTGLPAGFTAVPAGDALTNQTNDTRWAMFWKRATGNDTGTYDFTLSTSVYRLGIAARYTGCIKTGNPIDVDAVAGSAADGNVAFPDTSLTTTAANRLLIWSTGTWNGRPINLPAGFALNAQGVTDNSDGGLALAADEQLAAGATGTLSATHTVASDGKAVWVGALIPAPPPIVRSAVASSPASGPTNRTVNAPAGVVDGDVLLAVCMSDSVNTAHFVPPAGWSAALIDSQSGASNLEFRVYTKIASSEGASWTFTAAATADVTAVVVALRPTDIDTDTSHWIKQAAVSWATSDAPSLSGAGLLLLCAACGKPSASGTRTWTPPAGMTEQAEGTTVWVSVDVASLEAPPNPTLSRTFTPSAAVGGGANTLSILIPSASAGTDFTSDDDDAVGVTDAMAKDAGRTITDPVGVTDGLTKDSGRTITDPVGLSDGLAKDSGRTATDPVGLTDALSKDLGRTATDPVGLLDALTKIADYAREQTEAISVTDALVKDVGRTAVDTVGVTDAVGLSAVWDRVASEQVGLTDTAEFAQTFTRQPTDTVGITDAASFSADVVVETTDQVGVTDSIELSAGEDVAAVDAVEITDEASFDMGETVEADDQVGISDDISLDADYDRSVTDAIGVTDSLLAEGGLAREETDDVELTDSLEMSADWSPTFTDDIGITDAEIFVLIPAGDLSAIDLVGISDEAIFSIETAHEADDSVDVTDEAAWEQGRAVIDSVGLSDTAIFDISGESEWTDEVGITDSAQFDAADIHVTDLVGLTDGFTLSGIAENRMLVAEPENRTLVAEPEDRMLVAEPENRLLVAEPEDRMLVAEPEDRLLRAAEQRTLTADDGIP